MYQIGDLYHMSYQRIMFIIFIDIRGIKSYLGKIFRCNSKSARNIIKEQMKYASKTLSFSLENFVSTDESRNVNKNCLQCSDLNRSILLASMAFPRQSSTSASVSFTPEDLSLKPNLQINHKIQQMLNRLLFSGNNINVSLIKI